MLFGYARVSTEEQNLERQIEALEKEGCVAIFSDKVTGMKTDRPEFNELLKVVKKGDTILITDLTRFCRSTRDLFTLVDQLKERGVALKSLKDTWLDISSDNPYATFLLTVMSGVAQLERDLMKQRQKEGIEIARRKGVYKGRPKTYTAKNPRLSHAMDLYKNHADTLTVKKVCEMTGLSEATFYRNWKLIKEEALENE